MKRKADGYFVATDNVSGKVAAEGETKACCHCGGHFRIVTGSGVERGYCTLCDGLTCGAPDCFKHYPWEKKLDDYESGNLIVLR